MKLHPSKAHLWRVCPASAAFEGRFPIEQTEAARWGTVAHEGIVARLRKDGSIPAPEDKEMEETILTCVEYVERELRPFATKGLLVEESFVPQVHPELIPTVRPDVVAIDEVNETVHIADFKTGHRFVDAVGNAQGVCAASAFWGYPRFVFHVIQPRGFHSGGAFRRWAFDRAEMEEHEERLREAAIAASAENAPFVPTAECGLCSGRARCPGLRDAAIGCGEIEPSDPLVLTAEELGRELSYLDTARAVIEERVEALRVSVEAQIRNGNRVPGWTLRTTSGSLRWALPDEDVIAIYGDTVKKPAAPITPTQAKKLGLDVDAITARQPGAYKLEKTKWQ